MDILPNNTTVGDLCRQALKDAGALGVGQTPLAEDMDDAWTRLQWMLQQWERKRWLIYHLVTIVLVSTGAQKYTVGPGGQFDTGVAGILTARPNRIESAFLRQLTQSPPNQIDFSLKLLNSMEDYNKIALKQLNNFSLVAFYDPAWPLGNLYTWPIAQANTYSVGITVRAQLPAAFQSLATVINLPYEYYQAIVSNLAMALRPKYGITTYPGDMVPLMAKNGLATLRAGNTAITELDMPRGISRIGIYNIYSDQTY